MEGPPNACNNLFPGDSGKKKSGIDSFYSKFRQGKEITHSSRCFESVPEFTCLSNCSE